MKTIALIDLDSGGHRKAYMCAFAKACLELNTNVICIFPNVVQIQEWIKANIESKQNNITFVDFKPIIKDYKRFGRLNNAVRVFEYWRFCSKELKKIETQNSVKIDLVFFNWLDSQMANYLPPILLDFIFPYKWSGLYLHPVIFRIAPRYLENKTTFRDVDGVFLSKNCVAITLLDEHIREKYQTRIGKKTIHLPDIADLTAPDPTNTFANEIVQNANGRIVVGLIGLEPYKGTLNLMKLAKVADSTAFFFVFAGYYNDSFLERLPEKEKTEYTNFVNNIPENCIWQTGSLEEGEEYNAVICSFDIIYTVYENFYSSSNRLTKAANFHKLVLASNFGCVGDNLLKYKTGETVDTKSNIHEQVEKLEVLKNKILTKDFPYEQWKLYAAQHSSDRLKEKFEELLNLV